MAPSSRAGGPVVRPVPPVAPRLPAGLRPAKPPGDDLNDETEHLCLEFARLDLSGHHAESVEIDRCRFDRVVTRQGDWRGWKITDTVFDTCDLANLAVRDASLARVLLHNDRLTGTSLSGCTIAHTRFSECRTDLAAFRFATLNRVAFTGCVLTGADFAEADLRDVLFAGCDLSGARFPAARMDGVRFRECTLSGIEGVAGLRGATLDRADAAALVAEMAAALGITVDDG